MRDDSPNRFIAALFQARETSNSFVDKESLANACGCTTDELGSIRFVVRRLLETEHEGKYFLTSRIVTSSNGNRSACYAIVENGHRSKKRKE